MKLGIVISSNDAETIWNAFRLGNFALAKKDQISVFLLGKGVECESLDTDAFSITTQMEQLVNGGGQILACGTCLNLRKQESTEYCPISTLENLYQLIQESDKVLTF